MSYRSELIQVAAVAIAAIQNLDSGKTTEYIPDEILDEVINERMSQEGKWGSQNHDPLMWLAILGEEYGEVARAILEKDIE